MGALTEFLVGAAVIAAPLSPPARTALALGSAGWKAAGAARRKRKNGGGSLAAPAPDAPSSSPAVDLVFSDLRVTVQTKSGDTKQILSGVSGVAKSGR